MAANGTNSGSIFKVQKILSVILLSNLCLAWRKNKQLVWESWGLLNLRIIKHVTSKHHPKNFKKPKKQSWLIQSIGAFLFKKSSGKEKSLPMFLRFPNRLGPFWVTDDFPNFPWPVGMTGTGSPPERSPNAGCRGRFFRMWRWTMSELKRQWPLRVPRVMDGWCWCWDVRI